MAEVGPGGACTVEGCAGRTRVRIEILGAESSGVRGLSCVVEIHHRLIVIDPGLAA